MIPPGTAFCRVRYREDTARRFAVSSGLTRHSAVVSSARAEGHRETATAGAESSWTHAEGSGCRLRGRRADLSALGDRRDEADPRRLPREDRGHEAEAVTPSPARARSAGALRPAEEAGDRLRAVIRPVRGGLIDVLLRPAPLLRDRLDPAFEFPGVERLDRGRDGGSWALRRTLAGIVGPL